MLMDVSGLPDDSMVDECKTLRLLFPSLQLYKLNIHNVVAEFVPLIMNTIAIQVSAQAR